jgi:hypothetical protein
MVGGSLRVLLLLPPGRQVTAEILLKVAFNTRNQSINQSINQYMYTKQATTYDDRNPGSGLGQGEKREDSQLNEVQFCL